MIILLATCSGALTGAGVAVWLQRRWRMSLIPHLTLITALTLYGGFMAAITSTAAVR